MFEARPAEIRANWNGCWEAQSCRAQCAFLFIVSPLIGCVPLVILGAGGVDKPVTLVVVDVVEENPSRSQSVSVVFVLGWATSAIGSPGDFDFDAKITETPNPLLLLLQFELGVFRALCCCCCSASNSAALSQSSGSRTVVQHRRRGTS